MNKKRWLVVAGAAAVLLVAAVIVILMNANDNQPTSTKLNTAPVTSTPSSMRPSLSEENALQLEQELGNKNKEVQARALTPDLRNGDWKPSEALPVGSVLAVDRSSFDAEGNVGIVRATAKAPAGEEKFVLYLLRINGEWLIYDTLKG